MIPQVSYINPPLTELGAKFTQSEPDSVTAEEGDLLYALARMRKPKLAIETGTGHGIATLRIGEAVRDNGFGLLMSCDTNEEYVMAAQQMVNSQGLPVIVQLAMGMEVLKSARKPELIFIDAGNVENRLNELRYIMDRDILAERGLLIVHDAINKHYRQLPELLRARGWAGLTLESLAGIAVFQRP